VLLGIFLGCKKDNQSARPGQTVPAASEGGAAIGPSREESAGEPAPPLTPDIALEVNSASEEANLYTGTPLFITVRLANQRAANIRFANAAETGTAAKRPVPVVSLDAGWAKSVRLELRAADGKEAPWPLDGTTLVARAIDQARAANCRPVSTRRSTNWQTYSRRMRIDDDHGVIGPIFERLREFCSR